MNAPMRLFLASLALATAASGGTIYIDTFSCPDSLTTGTSGYAQTGISCGTSIGGARIDEVWLDTSAPIGSNSLTVESNPPAGEVSGDASVDASYYSTGNWRYYAIWNGSTTNANAWDTGGLGGVDLTDGGTDGAIDVQAEWSGPVLIEVGVWSVYDDGGLEEPAFWYLDMPVSGTQSSFVDLYFPFDALENCCGITLDPQDITEVQLTVYGSFDASFAFASISSVPEPAPALTVVLGIAALALLRLNQKSS